MVQLPQSEMIAKLKDYLIKVDYVGAAWLEGSFARGEMDEFSDIDLYIDCEDDKVIECKNSLFLFLQSLSKYKIKIVHNYFQNHLHLL